MGCVSIPDFLIGNLFVNLVYCGFMVALSISWPSLVGLSISRPSLVVLVITRQTNVEKYPCLFLWLFVVFMWTNLCMFPEPPPPSLPS